jgi:hypothetical protein
MAPPVRFEIDRLRGETLRLLQEMRVTSLLTCPLTPAEIAKIAAKELQIASLGKAQLRELQDSYKKQVAEVRRHLGVVPSSKELLAILAHIEKTPKGSVVYVPLWVLRRWFKHSDEFLLPPSETFYHKSVAIDPTGAIYAEGNRPFETRFLEGSLFEDMCALFNLARENHLRRHEDESRHAVKQRLALQRAAVVASFSVIEAYLNGIAFDYLETKAGKLDDATRALLTEWDSVKQRLQYLSLRDKLLKYPRLIMGVEHPPLQENNCIELRFVVETAKRVRDAIVHASPAPSIATLDPEKEAAVYCVDFETAERVVDATVTLIRKLEEKVNGGDHRLRGWLHARSADGAFPDVAFE